MRVIHGAIVALAIALCLATPVEARAEATPAPVFSLGEHRRLWFGETVTLTTSGCSERPAPVALSRVDLVIEGHRYPLSVTPAANGCSWTLRVGDWSQVRDLPFLKLFSHPAAICVFRAADGAVDDEALKSCRVENAANGPKLAVQKLDVHMGDQRKALLWAVFTVLAVVVIVDFVLKRAPRRASVKRRPPEEPLPGVIYRLLQPATTPMGTYSLATTQALVWSYVTLFALVYVWSMSATFVKFSSDIPALLGIGGATAVFSRAASSARTYVPQRYLALLHDRDRVPRLSDLLMIDGAPNVFKLQMLVFTLVTAAIVVKEVIEKCAFPPLPSELVTLMGISALTYLGSEVTPRELFKNIKEDQIAKIEALAKAKGKPFGSEADLRELGKDAEIRPIIDDLVQALAEVYGGEQRSVAIPGAAPPGPAAATPATATPAPATPAPTTPAPATPAPGADERD